LNSSFPIMCLKGFASATTGPSIEVVRNILLPQTMGEEWPRPGMGVFHWTFFVPLHSVGRFFSSDTPWPDGPLHCGQFEPLLDALTSGENKVKSVSRHAATAHCLLKETRFMIFSLSIRLTVESHQAGYFYFPASLLMQ
jgi:hypothetical protein